MSIPELGTLAEVDVRQAWDHEAHSFTPWLSQHLNQLEQAIGIPLELEGTEVRVESFSADILARNPQDGSKVLIENQLETTDHGHLGQIMTYLAGLDTHTVIWIAKGFREPHLSALRWLNEHTDDPFAFFAVRVRVVRIGDSPLAPIFEVVERPNNWERSLHEFARSQTGGLSDLGQHRLEFWQHHLERHPDLESYGAATAMSYRAYEIPKTGLCVVAFIHRGGVGMFVRGPSGSDPHTVFQQLEGKREQLESALGVALTEDSSGYYFTSQFGDDSKDRGQWDTLSDWLSTQRTEYHTAIQKAFDVEF